MWMIYVILGGITLFTVITAIRCAIGRKLLKQYKDDSLIIFGKKGHGKSLLFSEMTYMDDKNWGHISNSNFKRKFGEIIEIKELCLKDNEWRNVLKGQYHLVEKHESWEKKPVYIDDAGIYLPNFADGMLKAEYATLPLAFAVWRHLYDAPMHINCQAHDRVWKLMREQADGYIEARFTRWFLCFGFIHCTYYKKAESAERSLLPMHRNIFNKYSAAEYEKYKAEHGEIKDFLIFAPSWRQKYDSRWFHEKFFGKPAPKKTPKPKAKKIKFKPLQSTQL